MKALAFKELRELRGFAAVALVCYLLLVAQLMGAKVLSTINSAPPGTREIPFTGVDFLFGFITIAVVLAVALGFRQSAVESSRGTFLFLLHRPLSRNAILFTKLASGLAVFLVCLVLPLVSYAAWASIPRQFPGPFWWSMTAPAWWTVLVIPTLYLGAFLSGIRPARWFGTRLLPLVAASVAVIVIYAMPWKWSLGIPAAALVDAVLIACVSFVAGQRDYA
jgi:ABC-type transport system involved in multi-copper enzyme maturation permease subunit